MILAAFVALRLTFVVGAQSEPIGSLAVVIALLAVDLRDLLPADLRRRHTLGGMRTRLFQGQIWRGSSENFSPIRSMV